MSFDFENIPVPGRKSEEVEPRAILRSLPVRSGAINDLWDGQAQALTRWHAQRGRSDNLILLNTGAGKTIVGLLIAESLRRELRGNVVYMCANNDLVAQVAKEAIRLGLEHTIRAESNWSNDLFEKGRAICITNYQAVLNAFTQFKGSQRPDAVILDDAHVAEGIIRDQFSIKVTKAGQPGLFRELINLIQQSEAAPSWRAKLTQVVAGGSNYSCLMASPTFGATARNQLNALFDPFHARDADPSIKFPLAHVYGKWDFCAFCVSKDEVEISPPALPALANRVFSDTAVRRVYLSATLEEGVDFARAFGRQVADPIRPDVDAGNGERLILFSEQLGGDSIEEGLVGRLLANQKLMIAVPSYGQATRWKALGTPPNPGQFSARLDTFRTSTNGAFVLVGRYDGIDLPNEDCRVMVLDGVPRGTSLLERFTWEYLDLQGDLRSRIATRITQLFGRIIRGRVDHGVFLIASRALNNWLGSDRNLALLPDLLRNQLKLGSTVHESLKVKDPDRAVELAQGVLARQEGWTNFYSRWLNAFEFDEEVMTKSQQQQMAISKAAVNWVNYWSSLWLGDSVDTLRNARELLENQLPDLAGADARSAGWLNMWLGAMYQASGEEVHANDHFTRARNRIRAELPLPRAPAVERGGLREEDVSPMGQHFLSVFRGGTIEANNAINREDRALAALSDLAASPPQFEEAARYLGECMGFESSRPDNEVGSGPDVLWKCNRTNVVVGLEAKTHKTSNAYNKADIGQAYQHLAWIAENCGGFRGLGVCLVGEPTMATAESSPSDDMFSVERQSFVKIAAAYADLRANVREALGASKLSQVAKLGVDDEWSLEAIFAKISPRPLA